MNTKLFNDFLQHNTMSLTGEGAVTVTPNQAIIRLGVQTNGMDLVETQASNAQITQNVIDGLMQMGVTEIRTYQYQIQKNYTYENGTQIDNGYTVRNILEIKTDQLEAVGTIIDTAVANGANVVEFITFDVSNTEFYYQQALNLAVGNALQKSRSIAKYLDSPMEPIPFRIVENTTMQPVPMNSLREGTFATPIEPGNYTVNAFVSVDFYY